MSMEGYLKKKSPKSLRLPKPGKPIKVEVWNSNLVRDQLMGSCSVEGRAEGRQELRLELSRKSGGEEEKRMWRKRFLIASTPILGYREKWCSDLLRPRGCAFS